jgi:hypothetical protein
LAHRLFAGREFTTGTAGAPGQLFWSSVYALHASCVVAGGALDAFLDEGTSLLKLWVGVLAASGLDQAIFVDPYIFASCTSVKSLDSSDFLSSLTLFLAAFSWHNLCFIFGMRNSLMLLILVFVLSACGQRITETVMQRQSQSVAGSFDPESFYQQLPALDLEVDTSFTGTSVEQRESSTHICRRHQASGATVFQYLCYQLMNSGVSAQNDFVALQGSFGSYSVQFFDIVGAPSIEEITDGPIYGGGKTLCQKITPRNPSAASSYRCFTKL